MRSDNVNLLSKIKTDQLSVFIRNWWIIFLFFTFGAYWLLINPMGPKLSHVIGDLGDTRFNNFVLEHVYRWFIGNELSLWSPRIFYPYQNSLAFSDNLLGSAFFYTVFRLFGFDKYASFQSWFIFGFGLTYFSSAFVLKKYKLNQLSVSLGAFFFTFGLPVTAQFGHPQLIFRFCIPLAYQAVIDFSTNPKLHRLLLILFWVTWQLYISLYLGIFLFILILFAVLLIPFSARLLSIKEFFKFWLQRLITAWSSDTQFSQSFFLITIIIIFTSFYFLFQPYYQVSNNFGANRSWMDITRYLPTLNDYFAANQSQIWNPISNINNQGKGSSERQLFTGISIILLLTLGVIKRNNIIPKKHIVLNLLVISALFLLTISFDGFSLYWIFFNIPGVNSLRAISRFELVTIWPVAIIISISLNSIPSIFNRYKFSSFFPYVVMLFFILETSLITIPTYAISISESRIETIKNKIPKKLPTTPVLFISDQDDFPYSAVDSMFAAQDLGLPLLGGYTGWYPPGYSIGNFGCIKLPKRLLAVARYNKLSKNETAAFYKEEIIRIVPIGFNDCDSSWWNNLPDMQPLP